MRGFNLFLRNGLYVIAISFLIFSFCPASLAQHETMPFLPYEIKKGVEYAEKEAAKEEEEEPTIEFEFRSNAIYDPPTYVERMPGQVAVTEIISEINCDLKVLGKLPISISIANQYIIIKDSVPVKLPSRLTGLAADFETILPFFKVKDTYFSFGISPSFYSEDWSFNWSAFRIPQRYFLIYRPCAEWVFIGGLGVFPRYEDKIWPIVGFIYTPTDRLTFNIVPERPNITYKLNDMISIFAEGDMAFDEYAVSRPQSTDVILRYRRMRAGGGVELNFGKHINTLLACGGVFDRRFKYSDKRAKVRMDSGFYLHGRILLQF